MSEKDYESTTADGDCDNSDVCLISKRDDDSLSSVEGDDGTEPAAVEPLSKSSVWGLPGTPLYRAMEDLISSDETKRLENPSAAKADEMSHELHKQVDNLIMNQHGTPEQQEIWKNATDDEQHEWIASFFLAALS
ncbi:expressed unknown protein [Seminavis robusta]|uniref:Uncharacterized protein n=1 Tax=Seminavis robusta TaxID=568900 RepID=A0A9N8H343_9STRA|nr:expressed unknown protein [Seminavis robusta]|eukprot:Sro31_g019990.1 n/a (135) ;mRNA; r:4459-4863